MNFPIRFSYPPRERWVADVSAYSDENALRFSYPPRDEVGMEKPEPREIRYHSHNLVYSGISRSAFSELPSRR